MKDTFLHNLLLLITPEQILTLQMVLEDVSYVAWPLSNHDQIEIKRNAWIKIEITMLLFNAFSCYVVDIDGEIASLICSL